MLDEILEKKPLRKLIDSLITRFRVEELKLIASLNHLLRIS